MEKPRPFDLSDKIGQHLSGADADEAGHDTAKNVSERNEVLAREDKIDVLECECGKRCKAAAETDCEK